MNTRLALHILSPDIIREIYARALAIIYLITEKESKWDNIERAGRVMDAQGV